MMAMRLTKACLVRIVGLLRGKQNKEKEPSWLPFIARKTVTVYLLTQVLVVRIARPYWSFAEKRKLSYEARC